jgi:hypothetical protein
MLKNLLSLFGLKQKKSYDTKLDLSTFHSNGKILPSKSPIPPLKLESQSVKSYCDCGSSEIFDIHRLVNHKGKTVIWLQYLVDDNNQPICYFCFHSLGLKEPLLDNGLFLEHKPINNVKISAFAYFECSRCHKPTFIPEEEVKKLNIF